MDFDFNDWMELAQRDPAAFEIRRQATIRKVIDRSTSNRRCIEGLQFYKQSRERDKELNVLRQGKDIMGRLTKLSPNNARWRKDLDWFSEQILELEE